MAKSLRSKWKRKMRAVKRVRYGEKELAKLKMIVESAKSAIEPSTSQDVEMTNDNLFKVAAKWRPSRIARRKDLFGPKPQESVTEDAMEIDAKKKSNAFPVWMGSHKRKKLIEKNRALKKKKEKEMKKLKKRR